METFSLSRDRLIYLSGLVDGEGSINISKLNARDEYSQDYEYRLFFQVGLCNQPFMSMISDWLGSTYMCAKKKNRKPEHKLYYNISMQSYKAGEIIKLLEPFLILKKQQAQLGLKFQKVKTRNRGKNNLAELQGFYENCCLAMKQLNKRGR